MSGKKLSFPPGFIWGTATAAYQVEGGWDADGRSHSIWDTFSRTPGKVLHGHNGDTACDHYNRLDEDLGIIAGVVRDYRFSIAWPRILPGGTGAVNDKGVDFYDRLIDGLLQRGVTPWATMYHWDLPEILQDRGGWTNRDMLGWFSDYANVLREKFSDRVRNWMIVNEPACISWLGHGVGIHAPGLADQSAYLSSMHHINLVIGQVYRQMKAADPALNVGSCYTLMPTPPESADTPADVVAHMDGFWNRNFFDPLLLGRYPDVIAPHVAPFVQPGDMALAQVGLDFVGVQHYTPIVAAADDRHIFGTWFGKRPDDVPKTGLGWSIIPEAFYDCLTDFKKRYGDVPLLVTENGAAFDDVASADGRCHDPRRIAYLRDYIAAMHRAMQDGVKVGGYFVWSLLDNFEWAEGYGPRFGMVHVDYDDNCRRTPKDSYHWFARVVLKNAVDD